MALENCALKDMLEFLFEDLEWYLTTPVLEYHLHSVCERLLLRSFVSTDHCLWLSPDAINTG